MDLFPALAFTAVSMAALHWFPATHPTRLHQVAAYTIGVTTMGIFLSWHQYHHGSDWRLYWLFSAVSGAAVMAAWAFDKWSGYTVNYSVAKAIEQGMQEGRDRWERVK